MEYIIPENATFATAIGAALYSMRTDPRRYGGEFSMGIAMLFVNSLLEEFFFRGFAFLVLRRYAGERFACLSAR